MSSRCIVAGMNSLCLALNSATLAVCRAVPQAMPEGDVPDRLPVIPAGTIEGVDGRIFFNSDPDAVVRAFRDGGRELPIDVEHATHIKGPAGEPAPAVGWMTDLTVENGVIIATVAWNNAGRALVGDKAYRFSSPAFTHDATGRVIALRSLGLTNEPNFLQLPALNRETTMDRAKLIALLGLASVATDAEIEAAINTSLALNRQGKQPDPLLYVPKADLDAALNRATTAETQLQKISDDTAEAEAVTLVDGAVKDGKVAPASRDHYLTLCRSGQMATVKTMLATLPKLGAIQDSKTEGDPNRERSETLDEDQLAMCRRLGITAEQFLAAGKA